MKRAASFAAAATGIAVAAVSLLTARSTRNAERTVPQDGEIIDIDGQPLHVAQEGAGPPLILIHGLGGQMRNFAPALVADLARDYRVIRVDRPGSGYSPRARGQSANLPAQAKVIAGLIDKLGLDKPTLVGHSLGGALSLTVAVLHPDKVGRLLLIAPAAQLIGTVPPAFKGLQVPPAMRRMIGMTIAVPLAHLTADATLEQVFRPEPVPDTFLSEGGGALGFRPAAFEGASADLAEAEEGMAEIVAGYGALRMPTAILYGREDNILDYRMHGERTVDEIPGATLTVVDGGHMLPFTQPEMTAAWMRKALAEPAHG